jgi:hypothetical protein
MHGTKRLDRSVSANTGCDYGVFLRAEIAPDQGVLPRSLSEYEICRLKAWEAIRGIAFALRIAGDGTRRRAMRGTTDGAVVITGPFSTMRMIADKDL